MGCGKSKHDVASGNTTVLQRKKSSVNFKEGQENGTETKDVNNNVENVTSDVDVQQKESESNENDDVKVEAEKTNDEEEKKEPEAVEEPSEVEKVNDAEEVVAAETEKGL